MQYGTEEFVNNLKHASFTTLNFVPDITDTSWSDTSVQHEF